MHSRVKAVLVMLAISVGAAFLADFCINTDEKLIDDYLHRAESALESGDLQRCMALVHPRYYYEDVSAREIRGMCVWLLARTPARDVIIVKKGLEIAGLKATVYLSVLYLPKPESKLAYRVNSTWRVHLLKVKRSWVAIGLHPLTMGGESVSHLHELKYHVVMP